eukprot:TRINITY_DN2436_c0_g1_i1.p1 TRINITY_DN2436_c0_g1~~TRINITY_DN2436_c0_g1_i1.p1  ORF type:complete len:419 (+),score=54.86 TRINITY_DN2436_c0_g1_i1:687-1943(+)
MWRVAKSAFQASGRLRNFATTPKIKPQGGGRTAGYTFNFGVAHPAAHGVLRLAVTTDGEETITDINPIVGYLHRGTEKLMEGKTAIQSVPYMDRLDYVSTLSNEHGYSLCVERMMQIELPLRASYLRVLMLELTRILNHLLAITCHIGDLNAFTPMMWGFEEREKIMEFYERITGARMHCNWIIPGGVKSDANIRLLHDIYYFLMKMASRIDEMEELLTDNRLIRARLTNVGQLTLQNALSWGITGPLLRGCGVAYDVRVERPYEIYPHVSFSIPLGTVSDSMDRFLIRLEEMRQSALICLQCINDMVPGPYQVESEVTPPTHEEMKESMASLIQFFKHYSCGFPLPYTTVYSPVEHPKGEFGILMAGDGESFAYRSHIRGPGFYHVHALQHMVPGHQLADLVTIIGSIDIVLGEIDR